MTDCPQCGTKVDGLVCPKCRFSEVETTVRGKTNERRKQVEVNGRVLNMLLCQHVDRGQECAEIAVYSPSTLGGGPWFCRKHDPTRSDVGRPRVPPPKGFQALRNALKRALPGEGEASE